MSTTKSTKLKINDVAKELNTTGQELADFVTEKLGTAKKPTASLTEDEMNYVLEAFSQKNQVENFDAYFATKNQPAEEPKAEEKPAEKKAPKAKKETTKKEAVPKADKSAAEKPAAEKKAEPKAEKPAKAKKEAAPKTEKTAAEKPVEKKAEPKAEEKPKSEEPKQEPKKEQPATKPVNNQPQNKNDRFNTQQVLNADKKKKPEQKPQNKPAEQSNKKKLDVKFADASTPVENNKIHTIDTRGSYVEMDKYNEKYENIAPLPQGKHKDNFSKKQKLTQK
ncbi:MAG: translation initiation factor IF-2 N-terminal domain-containing protein, partial [Oscillospiraceae bacterium]|nr:translation initiation factor IF-2 N-terminal domain-containing protein [Oscillospiraceae bacterium]